MFDVHCFISPFDKIHCCVVSVASCVVSVVLCRLHKTESFSVGPSSFFRYRFCVFRSRKKKGFGRKLVSVPIKHQMQHLKACD